MSIHVKEVDSKTLKKWLDKGEVILIDVREHLEYKEEHIPKSQLFPSSSFDPRTLPDPFGKEMVFYCHLGRRSASAAQKWAEYNKLAEAYSLKGGIASWRDEGLPTVIDTEIGYKIEKQTYIFSGISILGGIILTLLYSSWFLLIPIAVSLLLIVSGISGHCYLSFLLSRLPWNK